MALCPSDSVLVAVQPPVTLSSTSAMTKIISCARLHGIRVGRTMSNRTALSGLLNAHACTDSCLELAAVLYVSPVYHTDTRPVLSSEPSLDPVLFPPAVLPRSEVAQIVQECRKASSSDSSLEQLCAACHARLTPHSDVSRVRDTYFIGQVLCWNGLGNSSPVQSGLFSRLLSKNFQVPYCVRKVWNTKATIITSLFASRV